MPKLTETEKFKQLEEKHNSSSQTSVIKKISLNKNQMISVKVNPHKYELFKNINKQKGMSNNSVINMLISEYVQQNMHEIE